MDSFEKTFKIMLLNDEYIKWLHDYMKIYIVIDNTVHKALTAKDRRNCTYLYKMFLEIKKSFCKRYGYGFDANKFCLIYNHNFYTFKAEIECFSCIKSSNIDGLAIEYDLLKQQYDIEYEASLNDVKFISLDELIDKILDHHEFYRKIGEELTPEERSFITNKLINKSCANRSNGSCRVKTHEKIGFDEFGRPQGSSCIGWSNHELVGKSKVLRITDINKFK